MKNWKIVIGVLLILCILTGCSAKSTNQVTLIQDSNDAKESASCAGESLKESDSKEEIPSFTSDMLIKELGAGWNLGNALDSCHFDGGFTYDTEQLSGNPITTKDMIDKIKKEGFGSVRIPVTYNNHMDENAVIDTKWLERIKEVVDYVRENDMYCIINVHHDTGENGWLKADLSSMETSKAKFAAMWSQIGQYFNEYDDHLIFEGYNEILNSNNQWSYAGVDSYQAANELNQVFVDTVRKSGGNNATRFLLVNTYAASSDQEVISHFLLPSDTAKMRLLVGVHSYVDTNGIPSLFANLNKTFLEKGIPVILTEFGMPRSKSLEERVAYTKTVRQYAKQYHVGFFWWDDGNYNSSQRVTDVCNYALFNRNLLQWAFPEIADALVQ